MATILTPQTLDSAARVSGETFDISTSAVLTIDTDTRYHINAPAGGLGSLGNITMSDVSGGTVFVDGTKVRWLAYTGGSGNVPAFNTNIIGNTSGCAGLLAGVYSAINVAPTGVGSAMPASGFIKLKSASTAFVSGESLTGLTATTNGVDKVGWLEIVMDNRAIINMAKNNTFKTRANWFELGNTTGTAGQVVQLPTCGGGANTMYAGVWIETDVDSNVYEFYPAQRYVANTTSGWYTTAKGTDARSKFVEMQDGGAIRIGANVSGNYGYTPVSGLKIRIPNLLFMEAAIASRSVNALPSNDYTYRPKVYTFNIGSVDVDGGMFNWYFQMNSPEKLSIKNIALLDSAIDITRPLTSFTLDNFNTGDYYLYNGTILITQIIFGGLIHNCKIGVTNNGNINLLYITYAKNIIIEDCIFQLRCQRINYGGYVIKTEFSDNIKIINCTIVGNGINISSSSNIYIENLTYADSFSTTTTTAGSGTVISMGGGSYGGGNSNIEINGGKIMPGFANIHPNNSFVSLASTTNFKWYNCGTYASPINGGTINPLPKAFLDGGNNSNIKISRVYFSNLTNNGFSLSSNVNTGNILVQNCGNMTTKSINNYGLDYLMKGICASGVYLYGPNIGTIFYNIFTSAIVGRVGLGFNEPSVTYSPYVFRQLTTSYGYAGTGGLYIGTSGDYVIYEFPYFIKGYTSFANLAPTSTGNAYTLTYQIDTGSGWNGIWKSATGANLSGETISASTGFKIKIKILATVNNVSNYVNGLYFTMVTNSTAQNELYPLEVLNLSITNLQVGSDVVIYQAGTTTERQLFETISGTSVIYTYETSETVDIGIFKAGYIPLYIRGFTLPATDASIPVAQVVDRAYL